jgi:hypothetical protein
METIGRDTSNLAAFGWAWTENGTQFELANARGTGSLTFGICPPDPTGQGRSGQVRGGAWSTVTVTAPERFVTEPPKTRKEWRVVVDRWFASSTTPGG